MSQEDLSTLIEKEDNIDELTTTNGNLTQTFKKIEIVLIVINQDMIKENV
jgi:hypothetical protein